MEGTVEVENKVSFQLKNKKISSNQQLCLNQLKSKEHYIKIKFKLIMYWYNKVIIVYFYISEQ